MTRAPKERAAPLSIRFTDAEKARLKEKAAGLTLGAYIRQAVLADETAPRRARHSPVEDGVPLGRLLALLGQSHLANNLNQIAKAASEGSLPVSEEIEADLRRACAGVFEMRVMLVRALGLRIVEDALGPKLAPVFAVAAEDDGE